MNKIGSEVQINESVEDHQTKPSITQLSNGDIVFTYKNYVDGNVEIVATKFDINLKKISNETVIKRLFKA